MRLHRSACVALLYGICLTIAHGAAFARDRAECEKLYQPSVGQEGKDVIWVPTDDDLVTRMLEMAQTTASDHVIDLGAGDGKIPIAAAKQFGATAVGIEYNPDMVRLAQCYAEAEGVADKVKIIQGDIFEEDFSAATVLTLYLLPDLNIRLRPKILEMRPGTRVVSHSFLMGDWEPDDESRVNYGEAYLWIVPAKVQGRWVFTDAEGREAFTLELEQKYQKISGSVTMNGRRQPLTDAALRGEDIRVTFAGAGGQLLTVQGKVSGEEMQLATGTREGARRYVGRRRAS